MASGRIQVGGFSIDLGPGVRTTQNRAGHNPTMDILRHSFGVVCHCSIIWPILAVTEPSLRSAGCCEPVLLINLGLQTPALWFPRNVLQRKDRYTLGALLE